jgi:hypothetical protein
MSRNWGIKILYVSFIGLFVLLSARSQVISTRVEATFGKTTTLASIRSIAVDSKDKVYILDNKDCDIKVFDGNGNLLRTIGKKGQGPGEFSAPSSLEITAKDEIIVFDIGNHRISVFGTNGIVKKEIGTGRWSRLFSIRSLGDGLFVGDVISYDGDQRIEELLVLDEQMNTRALISKLPIRLSTEGIDMYPASIRYGVLDGGDILWGNWLEDRVQISDSGGRIRSTIPLNFRQREITDSDRERVTKAYSEGVKPDRELIFPPRFPYYFNFRVVGERVFFLSFERGPSSGHYHYVLNLRDRTFSKLLLDPDPMIFRDGTYYCTSEDDQGNPIVKKISYRLNGEHK